MVYTSRMNDMLQDALERSRLRRGLPEARVRRMIREAAGLSQDDVARALGVARPTVTRWEGGHLPRGAKLDEYARLLNDLTREAAAS